MADIIIKILEPATNFDLLTLEEAKIALGIAPADTSSDAELQQMIDWNSARISQACNRVFAREKVRETWRCNGSRRVYLSHWPVAEADIESVEAPRGSIIDPSEWELEEQSGKLELFGSRAEPIVVTYTGGFNLPDDAPDDLKQVAALFVRAGRTEAAREATSGIRQITHKDSRIMFFDSGAVAASKGATGAGLDAAQALLYHYTRYYV